MNDRTTPPDGFLIEAPALQTALRRDAPLLIDARTPQAYAAGHLPGAVFLSNYAVFAPDTRPAGMAAFRDETAARFAAAGVSHERPVVVYEDDTGMRAAREMWILEHLGHRDVRMLHGGLRAWQAAGGALETAPVTPVAAAFTPQTRNDVLVVADELHQGLGRPGRTIVDVRDATEFAGRDHTECCSRRGHLPGAVWLEWTDLLADGRYRAPERIRAILRARGVPDEDELVPYCHRGARSANTYYALRLAGRQRVRNFIGSFHEWSARGDLPVQVPAAEAP